MSDTVTSTKPYLIRAIHEWAADNGLTPYLAVTVDERTEVPREFVRAGEIVLNVSMTATDRLTLGDDLIRFQARFGGVARQISVPVEQVSAIYARENGQGLAFDVPKPPAVIPEALSASSAADKTDASSEGQSIDPSSKEGAPEDGASTEGPAAGGSSPVRIATVSPSSRDEPPPPAPPSAPQGGRPRLTRVK